MPNRNAFTKKIRELSLDDIEYTEDFFQQTFGSDTEIPVTLMKTEAAHANQQQIAHEFSDEDIDGQWLDQEHLFDGQLAVDVFQTETDIIIRSTVAGVRAQDLDISMHGDMITIKGLRRALPSEVSADDYFIRECFWGGFSRSIILPLDIDQGQIEATLEYGVLTIRLPKSHRSRNAKIDVKEM